MREFVRSDFFFLTLSSARAQVVVERNEQIVGGDNCHVNAHVDMPCLASLRHHRWRFNCGNAFIIILIMPSTLISFLTSPMLRHNFRSAAKKNTLGLTTSHVHTRLTTAMNMNTCLLCSNCHTFNNRYQLMPKRRFLLIVAAT